jgi:3-oxoacyl-[acyl-carrier protein] reductase
MLENKYGKVVNFSTHAANQPTGLANAASYCAAKAATTLFSKTLSGEVGYKGININVIAPGPGATKFHVTGGGDPSMAVMVDKLAEAGLTTTPEDIGNVVAFLVSDISKKLTGQIVEVSAAMAHGDNKSPRITENESRPHAACFLSKGIVCDAIIKT